VALVGMMEGLWQRIAGVRPRLNPHITIRRHYYRNERWYLLQDPISERHFRLTPAAYQLISRFDGEHSLEALWQRSQQSTRHPLEKRAIIRLLMQLQGGRVLRQDPQSEALKLLERRERPRPWLRQLRNPLSLRLPLWDPDKMLNRLLPLLQPLFSRVAMGVWLVVVLSGLLQAALHWEAITGNVTSQLLAADNLLLMAAVYLLMKLFHEAAHGFATKHWGGEVHQVGVMLLALIPMPYVDASAANGFAERRARVAVGAAGIMVELLLASLGLWLWLASAPGWVNAAAYNMMLIGGLSTLLVNGNPLLRFDAYYVFADLIDIPNLSSRANQYLGYLLQRYLFGLEDADSPAQTDWERGWFIAYGIIAFFYRFFILFTIILFVAERYSLVGQVLAIWALVGMVILPLAKQIKFLFTSQRLAKRRTRALLMSASVIGLFSLVLFVIPAPYATHVEGVVLPPDGAEVRAGVQGEVVELLVPPDSHVSRDQPLLVMQDPFLQTDLNHLAGRLHELQAQYETLLSRHEMVKAKSVLDEMGLVESEIEQKQGMVARLTLLSPAKGAFLVQQPADLPGQYLHQGDLVGYVLDQSRAEVRLAVSQEAVGLVRQSTQTIEARYANRPAEMLAVKLLREVPESRQYLPSPALGSMGGGEFTLHPDDKDGTRSLEAVFEMRLELGQSISRLGERIIVRFEHQSLPLAWQWYRSLRQLFLKRFNL
jgi:putative peptide zinc metalloprotease protein